MPKLFNYILTFVIEMDDTLHGEHRKTTYKRYIVGQMPQASDPTGGHVSITVMRNSLNIHLTGIHALENLFSVKL